ncbi:P-loop containing nucleoside triphosphate hydrolase protein [Dimargaris cristalligena]|uniref:P-loop containing nucleoside triphosphate hydrolase protein n=1 Tax=Dimargaris cristalligena TaxID=215637 RepID=A0A4P9ZZW5_9FUNG|nr:P-loop containing nucleoside triphosphate hydrolase protein [Dimargaris cristalligena]|eukprot:RKP38512.1 P-loop containing nucleoside triphosphate hydrolase protein [Dimargaris cristalligena]
MARPTADHTKQTSSSSSSSSPSPPSSYSSSSSLALRDVSFSIKPRTWVGITGRSGSGKSTVLHLIDRLYDPTRGTIRWGGQEDLRHFPPTELRRRIAMVPQRLQFFPGTVKWNIAYGSVNSGHLGSAGSTRAAAKAAGLAVGVGQSSNTPNGDPLISLNRSTHALSAGEKQRVALARALGRNADLYLLDEPTANLDALKVHDIMANLRRQLDGATVLIVTHSIALLDQCQQILVFDQGQLVQNGSPDDLLQDPSGILYQMYNQVPA